MRNGIIVGNVAGKYGRSSLERRNRTAVREVNRTSFSAKSANVGKLFNETRGKGGAEIENVVYVAVSGYASIEGNTQASHIIIQLDNVLSLITNCRPRNSR